MIAQFALGISLLVGLHEMGHLLAAKLFGMRVEKYSIGFPPKVWGFTWRGTEYSLGAIPMGGFVKISGMIDESMDKEAMALPPQPWEFRAKPAYQRLIVMLGGIIVNVITGVVIYAGIVYFEGEEYIPASEARYGIVAGDLAQKIGLRNGDKIVKVNGKPLERFNDALSPDILLGSDNYYTINRNGQELTVQIPNNLIDRLADSKFRQQFLSIALPFHVQNVQHGTPAEKMGLQAGDQIIRIGSTPIQFFHQAQAALLAHKNALTPIVLLRGGNQVNTEVTISPEGTLGFRPAFDLKTEVLHYSLLESVPKGAEKAYEIVSMNVRGFGKIFKREVSLSNSLQGPIAMAQDLYGGIWDWSNFWRITALLSMALAFMNLLPIPALDGGHSVFLIYEMVSRRKPSERFLENAQKTGMAILLALMVFTVFNDVFRRVF